MYTTVYACPESFSAKQGLFLCINRMLVRRSLQPRAHWKADSVQHHLPPAPTRLLRGILQTQARPKHLNGKPIRRMRSTCPFTIDWHPPYSFIAEHHLLVLSPLYLR